MTWTPLLQFTVYGCPKAQPRPRAFARKFSNGTVAARVYDAGTAEGWKSLIADAARPHLPPKPAEGPIRLGATFYFPRPKCLSRKKDPEGPIHHTARPDRDNLEKALLDCLTTIGVFADDAQVCQGEIQKYYVAKGGRPCATVSIEVLAPAHTAQPIPLPARSPAVSRPVKDRPGAPDSEARRGGTAALFSGGGAK